MNIQTINKELKLNEQLLTYCLDDKERLQLIIQRSYLKDMLIELLYTEIKRAS
jgi:hypothetical protein